MGESPTIHNASYYKQYYNNSNTLFVYAYWKEVDYYDVKLSIDGEGSSQLTGGFTLSAEDAVRILLRPKTNNCLSSVKINGVPVSTEQFIEITKFGLVLKALTCDTTVDVTSGRGNLEKNFSFFDREATAVREPNE